MSRDSRNVALDRVRTFLTLVVLLHHSVIPYTHFGHTDSTSWLGFDVIVLATDSFFMAMFFFLSGLFVWRGLERKSPSSFLRERLLRLALPGAVAAIFLIPIGYYALAVRQTPDLQFLSFWWKTVTVGPWPSGPIWFIWLLLVFDTIATVLYRLSPALLAPIGQISRLGFEAPARFWLFFVVSSEVAYLPLILFFGGSHWLTFGPFAVQTSRILLYLCYFLIGAGVGASDFSTGTLSRDGRLPKNRWSWASASLIFYAAMWVMIFIKRQVLNNPASLPLWYPPIYATCFVLFSVSILFAIFAFGLNSKSDRRTVLDIMQADAYGIFLVHYPITLWLQYFLLDQPLPAIVKAMTVFILTILLSWGVIVRLRKIPGANRVL